MNGKVERDFLTSCTDVITDRMLPHVNARNNYVTHSKMSHKENLKAKFSVRSVIYWCLWKDRR